MGGVSSSQASPPATAAPTATAAPLAAPPATAAPLAAPPATASPPVPPAVPPVQGSVPPAAPPVQGSVPPAAPPVQGSVPPVQAAPVVVPPEYVDSTLASVIIANQQKLINTLQTAIQKTSAAFKINATKENFTNVNVSVPDYYTSPIPLTNSNVPEVSDYISSYNQSIALLNDPNNLNKIKFDTYMYIQNKKLNDLQNAIASFPSNGNIPEIKALKNIKNSASINVEPYPDPKNKAQNSSYTGNGATVYPNYLIYGNNGCLQYNPHSSANTGSITSPNWNFQSCNSNLPQQRFNINQINTLTDYNAKIKDPNNKSYMLNDINSTSVGFYVVSPETDPNQCLMLNGDGLSVMPCTLDVSQRFKTYYNSITP